MAVVPDFVRRGVEMLSPAARERREAEEARLRTLRDRRKSDLRWLMSEPQGRRIVAKLMAQARLQDSTHHPDQRMTERLEGARDFALALASELIATDHKLWLLMLEEAWVDAVNAKTAF